MGEAEQRLKEEADLARRLELEGIQEWIPEEFRKRLVEDLEIVREGLPPETDIRAGVAAPMVYFEARAYAGESLLASTISFDYARAEVDDLVEHQRNVLRDFREDVCRKVLSYRDKARGDQEACLARFWELVHMKFSLPEEDPAFWGMRRRMSREVEYQQKHGRTHLLDWPKLRKLVGPPFT